MDRLSDDELRAEYRHALLMGNLAADAGETVANTLFVSVRRACEKEIRRRGLQPA